jgi:hypothetical protein
MAIMVAAGATQWMIDAAIAWIKNRAKEPPKASGQDPDLAGLQ